jgi:hypothetical protein
MHLSPRLFDDVSTGHAARCGSCVDQVGLDEVEGVKKARCLIVIALH